MTELKELIDKYHNQKLIIITESPNANTIYHIYSDGSITYTKGGYAYGMRSEFEEKPSITSLKDISEFFPIKGSYLRYAIATLDHCLEIRNYLQKNSSLHK